MQELSGPDRTAELEQTILAAAREWFYAHQAMLAAETCNEADGYLRDAVAAERQVFAAVQELEA